MKKQKWWKKEFEETFYEADGKYGYGLVWKEDNKFISMDEMERFIEYILDQEIKLLKKGRN